MYNILTPPAYYPYRYHLINETKEDIRVYNYYKERYDVKKAKAKEHNDWLIQCQNEEISCSPAQKEMQPKPMPPRSMYLTPWMENRPFVMFTVTMWTIIIMLWYMVYDTIVPRVYTINERKDRTYQGRLKYTLNHEQGTQAFMIGTPHLFPAWWRRTRTNHKVRHNKYLNKDDGRDTAEEIIDEGREFDRKYDYAPI